MKKNKDSNNSVLFVTWTMVVLLAMNVIATTFMGDSYKLTILYVANVAALVALAVIGLRSKYN
ncbi:hypothetical protein [Arcanobacterium phocae]|uniref:hypothetical protein n=1 Tax=Arcanobacterium phocae TaxID=131112 RepID=UPI001C0EDAA0|nr:hypothetical protein [Arcanobacterium phocae]